MNISKVLQILAATCAALLLALTAESQWAAPGR